MRVLVIKTSSLGDVIHTLPALSDACKKIPDIRFDWVVEEAFAEIPSWHHAVDTVIPIAQRRWRKNKFRSLFSAEFRHFLKKLRCTHYDYIIDAQGLLKSAWLTPIAKGKRLGFDKTSAREPLASWFYQQRITSDRQQHAIHRVRELFSKSLGYSLNDMPLDYGIARNKLAPLATPIENPYLIFLHGTTWDTKLWPESHWISLANIAQSNNIAVKLLWGNPEEKSRAEKISHQSNAEILPKLPLSQIASLLAGATGIVTVDTGLGHLAVAMNVPTISLYGPTDPKRSGMQGQKQLSLAATFPACAPCMSKVCTYQGETAYSPACLASLTPETVWKELSARVNWVS